MPCDEYLEPRMVALANLGSTYCLLGDSENSENVYLDSFDIMRVTFLLRSIAQGASY